MTLAVVTRREQVLAALRRAAPLALLAGLVVVAWWVGIGTALLALFGVACWRTKDPECIRCAIEMTAHAVVLLLTALAILVSCARGRTG